MTPEQVAEYLQLDKETVYRLIRDKQLAATRVGRNYRIPREDLETFLAANSTRPAVRAALFARLNAIAERNPGLSSDDVLAELEREDDARKRRAVS
ncbi:MAG: helix-turn-helix domain-containing protein [Chloroflexi bacterium]|nr:helix-turn-helix domain-containing protein [Chloroflexota bacterium]